MAPTNSSSSVIALSVIAIGLDFPTTMPSSSEAVNDSPCRSTGRSRLWRVRIPPDSG
jgi:hypothetical protein